MSCWKAGPHPRGGPAHHAHRPRDDPGAGAPFRVTETSPPVRGANFIGGRRHWLTNSSRTRDPVLGESSFTPPSPTPAVLTRGLLTRTLRVAYSGCAGSSHWPVARVEAQGWSGGHTCRPMGWGRPVAGVQATHAGRWLSCGAMLAPHPVPHHPSLPSLFIGIWSVWCTGFSAARAAAATATSVIKHSDLIRQAPGTGLQGLCRNPSTAGIRRVSKEDRPAFPLLRPRVSRGFFLAVS